jgi:hypothetical protein
MTTFAIRPLVPATGTGSPNIVNGIGVPKPMFHMREMSAR